MATSGPNFPTAATGNTATIGGGTLLWSSATNIEANDGAFATRSMTIGQTTDDLIGTGFGFSIPSTATINGITLEINAKASANSTISESVIKLLKAGAAAGNNKNVNTLTTTATTFTFGGVSDLWGTTWTPSDINNANFGAVAVYTASGSATASVDFFRITVTFTPATGAGLLAFF